MSIRDARSVNNINLISSFFFTMLNKSIVVDPMTKLTIETNASVWEKFYIECKFVSLRGVSLYLKKDRRRNEELLFAL